MPKTAKKSVHQRTDVCSNPFNLPKHGKKRLKLRKITTEQLHAWNIPETPSNVQMRICIRCRLGPSLADTTTVNEESRQREEVCIINKKSIKILIQ